MSRIIPASLLSLLLSLAAADCLAQATAKATTADGRGRIVLENELLRLTVDPSLGRATEATLKAGGLNFASPYGLFGERMAGFGPAFEARVAESGPERAAVVLTQRGGKPPEWNLEITKTISIARNSAAVRVEYAVANTSKASTRLAIRAHNGVIFPGAVQGSEDSWYSIPSAQGVRVELDQQPKPGERVVSGDFVEVAPVEGWVGGRSLSDHAFVATMDWRALDVIYCYLDKSPGATAEWGYNEMTIQPGETFRTAYVFTLCSNLPALHGARGDALVGIDLPAAPAAAQKTPVKVHAATGHALRGAKVVLELATRPEEKGVVIGESPLDLAPGRAASAAFEVTLPKDATSLLTATLREGDTELAQGRRVVTLGKSSRGYLAATPAGGKVGNSSLGVWFRQKFIEGDRRLPEHYQKMDLATVTPHVDWMRPNAAGPVKVIFVSRPDYFKYSVRELYQRFEIEPDFMFVFEKARAGVFNLDEYRPDVIDELGRTIDASMHDVIYLVNIRWDWLPEAFRTKLLDRVNAGLGVVVSGEPARQKPLVEMLVKREGVQKEDGRPLNQSISPVAALGVTLGGVESYRLGRGRVVYIPMAGFLSGAYDHFLPMGTIETPQHPWWEQVYALYGRAILRAAGKDAGAEIAPKEIAARGGSAQLAGPATPAAVRCAVYDDDLREVAAQQVKPAGETLNWTWDPPLVNGRYTLALTALDEKGRSLGFAARAFRLEPQQRIGIQLDKPCVRGETRPVAQVSVTSPEPVKGRIEARLLDAHGRTLYRQSRDVTLGADETKLAFDLKGVRTVCAGHQFVVDLWSGDRRLSTAAAEVRIFAERAAIEDEFVGAIWGTSYHGPYARALLDTARQCGITRLYVGPPTHPATLPLAVRMGFDFYGLNLDEIQPYVKFDSASGTFNPGHWDDAVFAAARDNARKIGQAQSRDLAVDHYILRDEYHLLPEMLKDKSPRTLEMFRATLKTQYRDLTALNTEWDTQFKDWAEIQTPTEKNVPAWVDWVTFWNGVMVRHLETCRDAVRETNPRAQVGLSGTQRPSATGGMDWPNILRVAGYFHRYNHFQEDWMASFGGPGLIQGQWVGYGSSSEGAARFEIWANLLSGSHLIAYYKLMQGTSPNQDMAPATHDLRLRPYYQFTADEMPRVRNGIGRLVLACAPSMDPIALYYSQPTYSLPASMRVDSLGATYALKRLLEDCGFRHTVVDSRVVAAGALSRTGIKVLVLPQIAAVSPAERDALTAFVQAGGVLLADQKSGLCDGHGKPYKEGGALDSLFGLRAASAGAPTAAAFTATADAGPSLRNYSAMQVVAARTGIVATTAKPWLTSKDGVPLLFVNHVGKGKAVYLNLDLSNYASSAASGVFGEVMVESQGVREYTNSCADLMLGLLADTSGLKPRATVRAEGAHLPDTRTFYHAADGLELVSVLWRAGQPARIRPEDRQTATVTLPRKGHVYELRAAGKYFGETDRAELALTPCVPALFALLPYEVAKVELTVPAMTLTSGDTVKPGTDVPYTVKIIPQGGAKPVLHVVRIEVFRPDGTRFDGFCANLTATKGECSGRLPLALDDPAGKWTVVATDVISGKSAKGIIPVGR
jgi:hypothetical protein